MASQTPRQKRITGRVMHELKHGELKGGRNGKGGKVKSRRQAIAIALEEAGASRYESGFRNRRNLRRTERRRLRDEQDSRNVRASPTSARTRSPLWDGNDPFNSLITANLSASDIPKAIP